MKKVGIFYGPMLGSTEIVAHKIAKIIGEDLVDVKPIKDTDPDEFIKYEILILGIATVGKDSWNGSHEGNDWTVFLPKLIEDGLSGKKVALFGLGNQVLYSRHFVNDMGFLYQEIKKRGAKIIGECSTEGYDFIESEAIINDKFVGLPLDEDTEDELTHERVKKWVALLKNELGI